MSTSDTLTPKQSRGPIRKKSNSLQNAALLKVMLSAIAETPRSKDYLAEITGLQRTTICRWINILAGRKGEIKNLVYIAEWGRSGKNGHPVALWKLGYGMYDAPKPKPKTAAEYCKTWRMKKARKPTVTETEKGLIHVAR